MGADSLEGSSAGSAGAASLGAASLVVVVVEGGGWEEGEEEDGVVVVVVVAAAAAAVAPGGFVDSTVTVVAESTAVGLLFVQAAESSVDGASSPFTCDDLATLTFLASLGGGAFRFLPVDFLEAAGIFSSASVSLVDVVVFFFLATAFLGAYVFGCAAV